jgi:hypothetical protein
MSEDIYWLQVIPFAKDKGVASESSRYKGMYVRLTGSGSNIAIITPQPPKFLRSHLDGTNQKQIFTSWKNPGKNWSLRLVDSESIEKACTVTTNTNLPRWSLVEIREEPGGDQGFYFKSNDSTGPTLSHLGCKGWIISEWAYGHPQLFYLTAAYNESMPLPDFCERVSLVKAAVVGQGEEPTTTCM